MSDNTQVGKIGWIDMTVDDVAATAAMYQP
jgi:hypothetical protein